MTRSDLALKTAMTMDELSSSDEMVLNVGIEDNNPLALLIDGLLDEAVNATLAAVPQHRLTFVKTLDSVNAVSAFSLVSVGERSKLAITLPTDFLRLVSITTKNGFARDIMQVCMPSDALARRQDNAALRAGSAKPVAVLRNGDGGQVIDIYSLPSGSTLEEDYGVEAYLTYAPRVAKGDSDYTPSLDSYLTDIAAWWCASLVFSAQGDASRSAAALANAKSLMV